MDTFSFESSSHVDAETLDLSSSDEESDDDKGKHQSLMLYLSYSDLLGPFVPKHIFSRSLGIDEEMMERLVNSRP